MVSEEFCTYTLSLFKQTTTAWAQLHSGEPGDDGLMSQVIDGRRLEVRWGDQQGPALVSQSPLIWRELKGVPGFPQEITHVTLWSNPTQGVRWATLRIPAVRVPHLATFEIPAGLTLRLA
jgi:hypothetical protein